MRTISAQKVQDTVAKLCLQANFVLRKDVLASLKSAFSREPDLRVRRLLGAIIQNAAFAGKESLAICQDTGLPCVFIELGQELKISGDLKSAVIKGVAEGYRKGHLRNSLVRQPLLRGACGYCPPIIHIDIVKGAKLKLTVLPKGFGCENKSQLKMFKPTTQLKEIREFVINAVSSAGADACPPYIVGVGIGGTADYAAWLAKKALLKRITPHFRVGNKYYIRKSVVRLEKELLFDINRLNIGPMGLGGKTTALAVNVQTYPTHIAGLPVAVNISCHALRSATAII